MRWLMGGMALLTLALIAEPAAAQTYPWCAHYGGRSGAKNCGFVSFQQCQMTVSGVGGHCAQNPFYFAEGPRRVRKVKRRVYY
jgi:hypothetical protein